MGAPLLAVSSIPGLGWRDPNLDNNLDCLPLRIPGLDGFLGGCPRGRITEIAGGASAGRNSILHRLLAQASANGEYCAIVDTSNAFDPESAAAAGVRLDTLVWVRCSGNAEHAMKTADLLIHSGGFGVVALDFCDTPAQSTRRIPLSYWHRFRRAVENTSTVLAVLGREPHAKSCATLLVEVKRTQTQFTGSFPAKLLHSAGFTVTARKPYRAAPALVTAVCRPA
jgi:hypothetical protein